ncbi:amidohydrolase family protein [Thermaerobacillus caldiproteolyticus]|uniref:amidohydrolase family protein n=1 Tax=Thermaerobacillus caldiproteolyticus TaxID=247480 RepID=UPI001E53B7F9|nr:amidohydrolase family protein [Anoxybacillus caldiproteolyticus]
MCAAILEEQIPIEIAIRVITSNPADLLKLTQKVYIEQGCTADFVLVNQKDLQIDTVISKGKIMVEQQNIVVKGTLL